MTDEDQARSLDRVTCLELLRSVEIGRVAWASYEGRVFVMPVNFVLDAEAVIIRTAAGSKVTAVEEGRPISFEADDVEPSLHVGWSVLVFGVAGVVEEPDEIRRLRELPLTPWERTPKPTFLRLPIQEVTGRRLPLRRGGVTYTRLDR
jgi:nitroimidazol reductase NimA-like FMN-containing flavoprotein (pyridoxamine 5'-phosphate oxidase superfamily)